MNTDIEKLLRDGMERFTAEVRAPTGLARTARQLHRRRLAARAAVACGAAAVIAAAAVVAVGADGIPAQQGPDVAQARMAAYVISRVEKTLASTNLVFRGRTVSTGQTSVTWAYGARYRYEEFSGGKPVVSLGTALIDGKLTDAYVTYYNREYSLSPLPGSPPGSACSTNAALGMGGPPATGIHWRDFIQMTLACGAARVTGHVWIGGVETTKITGSPVKIRLSPGYARVVHEKWAQVQWTLYVNPTTYLPVRMYGSTQTFGGPAPSTRFPSVTDVRWLPPTAANIAKTLITIPAGFHRVNSPAHQ